MKRARKNLVDLALFDFGIRAYDGSYIRAHKIDAVMLVKEWQEKEE